MKIGCRDDIRFFLRHKIKGELFCFLPALHYLCTMKQKIDWKMFFLFLVVCGGLYILTHSFFMSLGILLLLFVGENFYNEYRDRHRRKDK